MRCRDRHDGEPGSGILNQLHGESGSGILNQLHGEPGSGILIRLPRQQNSRKEKEEADTTCFRDVYSLFLLSVCLFGLLSAGLSSTGLPSAGLSARLSVREAPLRGGEFWPISGYKRNGCLRGNGKPHHKRREHLH